jgi:hypothetical protein
MLIMMRNRREAWLDHERRARMKNRSRNSGVRFWSTQVPSKVKISLWRLAKQSIPTNSKRHRRHMADSSSCQLCGAHDTCRHVLIDNTTSRCVWALVDESITEHMTCSDARAACAWLATMIATLKKEEHIRVFVTLWAIWHA